MDAEIENPKKRSQTSTNRSNQIWPLWGKLAKLKSVQINVQFFFSIHLERIDQNWKLHFENVFRLFSGWNKCIHFQTWWFPSKVWILAKNHLEFPPNFCLRWIVVKLMFGCLCSHWGKYQFFAFCLKIQFCTKLIK